MFLGSLLVLAAMAGAAAAQYQPIPNFTGIGAGFNFRQAINQRFSGAQSIAPQIVGLPFASLPAEQDGLLLWCKDCQATTPCSAGGAGAWAMGARGAWACAAGALEQDLNANGHNIIAASSVKADQPGDSQYRELLVPGNGIKVGNGTTAPFTVDRREREHQRPRQWRDQRQGAALSCQGRRRRPTTPRRYRRRSTRPAPRRERTSRKSTCPRLRAGCATRPRAPILLNCSLKFNGAGWQQTQICQNYYGPTIIAQAAEAGWKPPLTASVTATWQRLA